MRIANIVIGFLFLLVAIHLTGQEPPHKHVEVGEPYRIASGTLCDSLRYCETTGKRIIFKDKHISLTKEDSIKYKLGKFK